MERFDSMPQDVVHDWSQKEVGHPAGEEVPFHYHVVEVWLNVTHGSLQFVTVGERELAVTTGQALRYLRQKCIASASVAKVPVTSCGHPATRPMRRSPIWSVTNS